MFRRKTVPAQAQCEEKSVYDTFNKLIAAQTRVSEQQLRWAKAEENPLFLCLFGRLAELSWMGNELIKQFQDKQTELNRVFRDVDQEERIVDESRKALLTCKAKYMKLQKQLEHSKRKNDTAKVQSLEIELTTQGSLHEHLKESLETQSQKLELYKIDLLKKGLQSQAQKYLEITLNYQALFNAQLQLVDMLPLEPPPSGTPQEDREVNVSAEMKLLLSQVTENLHLYPPTNGGINVKKLSELGQYPPMHRRSSSEEIMLKMARGRAEHSISQPVLVGHSQLEEPPQVPCFPPNVDPKQPPLEDMVVNSGDYCEIDLSTGLKRSLRRTQSGYTSYKCTASKQWHKTRNVVKSHDLYHSTPNEENASAGGSSCSSEDLNAEKESPLEQETPRSESRESDECYANPVDAINEFLRGNNANAASSEGTTKNTADLSSAESLIKSPSEELDMPVQPNSKEQQLQLFHERLFKDSSTADSDGSELAVQNGHQEYSEINDEPTYSNPFDALAANTFTPFRVTTEKLKRNNVSTPPSVRQLQQQSGLGSSPPPPIPNKDEKQPAFCRRPVRYGRRGSGDSDGGSAGPVQMQAHAWERREPIWKRKNSNRGNDEHLSPTHMTPGGKKPQAPVSVAERLRQIRQRSQSDGVIVDETHLLSRPPMPLPISEQERAERNEWGQVCLNGQAHQVANSYNRAAERESGKIVPVDMKNSRRQKALLERTSSDTVNQHQSVYYARRGMALVVPLSAKEIVQQHMSHVAY